MDVDSIDAGLDFVDAIEAAVGSCDVLGAIIGPGWADAVDERGHRRLDDPDDIVVLEITTALRRGIRVIPVLVDGAPALLRAYLTGTLAAVARRQGVRLDQTTFGVGITTLMTAVERAPQARAAAASNGRPGPPSKAPDRPAGTGSTRTRRPLRRASAATGRPR